jgi:hypothetical protein
MTPEIYWQKLHECGWLAEAPSHTHKALQESIKRKFVQNPTHACFSLMTSGFDSECIYGTGPENSSYHDMIVLLAKTSYGLFTPSNIRDVADVEHLKIHISFTMGISDYNISVNSDNDYFDFNVIQLINYALTENGVNNQFIDLPCVDQIFHLVFVSERTYHMAEKLRLIPPPKYFDYKERTDPDKLNNYLEEFYKELDMRYE